jgi:hypothetical protein
MWLKNYTYCTLYALLCRPAVTRNVLLHTSHVLAVSSSSLNLQTIKLSTTHIVVDLTYYCTALTTTVSVAVRTKAIAMS